MREST